MIISSTGKLGKLGKLPRKIDGRTLKLRDYLEPSTLPIPPASVDWTKSVASWPMMGNDVVGDCTCAGAGHMEELWTANAGKPFIPSTEQVIKAYSAITGYLPADPSTDRGACLIDVLNYWRKKGIGGHKILAYVAVNWKDPNERLLALELFGGLYVGVQLPLSAQGQTEWVVPPGGINSPQGAPGSWGGHCIPIVAEDQQTATCVTWGQLLKMTPEFLLAYLDEAYALLSADWIGQRGQSPAGFNLVQLQADLAAIAAK